MISGRPKEPFVVPDALTRLIGDAPFEFVWQNEIGGLTVHVGGGVGSVYVKWMPHTWGVDLSGEVARLRWASAFTPVPVVLDVGNDEDGSWFVSRAIDAESAVSERWRGDPRTATTAVGEGLRALHEALDVPTCPFKWSTATRLVDVERRAAAGFYRQHEFGWDLRGTRVADALAELRDAPAEDLVVCHGDACAPNTLLDENGQWVAHVDFGRLGVGDRWADLAVATWSAVWNFGPEWEDNVFDAYGLARDEEKIRYYRLLWELG